MREVLFFLSIFFFQLAFSQEDSMQGPKFLDGHENDVTAVAYSPDGTYIVSGDWSGQVNFYFNNDSMPSFYLNYSEHDGPVTAVAFSRDSKKVLTGGMDGDVHLYSIDDSTSMIMRDTTFHFTTGEVTGLFYGPGLRMIFVSDDQGKFFAWDLEKRVLRTVEAGGPITAFAVSIDRMSYFIATKGSTEIVQYDILGKEKRRFSGHEGNVTAIAVTVDRKSMISASEDKSIRVWNLASGKEEQKFEEHGWSITGLAVDPYSAYVASCGLDGIVNVHEIKTGELKMSFDNPDGRCVALSMSTDLKHIIVALQLKHTPSGEFGYGCNIWSTGLTPPKPKSIKAYKRK